LQIPFDMCNNHSTFAYNIQQPQYSGWLKLTKMTSIEKLKKICQDHGFVVNGNFVEGPVYDTIHDVWEVELVDLTIITEKGLYEWLGY